MKDNKYGNPWKYMGESSGKVFKAFTHSETYQHQVTKIILTAEKY